MKTKTKNISILNYLNQPNIFVRYSGAKSFKINPNYEWCNTTPQGFYGFPFDKKNLKKALTLGDDFWFSLEYMLLFKINGKILYTKEYSKENMVRDVQTLMALKFIKKQEILNAIKEIKEEKKKYPKQSPFLNFWLIIEHSLANDNDRICKTWRNILLKLGYDAIYDNLGFQITPDLPVQVVVFNNKAIKKIGLFNNTNYYEFKKQIKK